ncbi:MAG: MerR family transcriptional regulator [Actinomycetota bacterium]|nr:MerR family transcriptional regulator [Actinomycetota bacterium]
MGMTVGEVARVAGISVRTLHHYDEIGLLRPTGRSDAGYRLYENDDLALLQQIMFFRELGFGLPEIGRITGDPAFDRLDALRMQRRMLEGKSAQLAHMIDAVDAAIASAQKGVTMAKEDMFEAFGEFDPAKYEDEVRERWGETDAYKESAKRTARYTKEDWKRFKDESEEIGLSIAALMDEGVASDDPRAMDAVERYRLQIDQWFYPCSHEMHVGLGEMYVADPRFTAAYEKVHVGMAQFVCDAIRANAARAADS